MPLLRQGPEAEVLELGIVEHTLVGVNPALDAFTDHAAALKKTAETDAVRSGREIAGLRQASPPERHARDHSAFAGSHVRGVARG
jgi:hypothetical protein